MCVQVNVVIAKTNPPTRPTASKFGILPFDGFNGMSKPWRLFQGQAPDVQGFPAIGIPVGDMYSQAASPPTRVSLPNAPGDRDHLSTHNHTPHTTHLTTVHHTSDMHTTHGIPLSWHRSNPIASAQPLHQCLRHNSSRPSRFRNQPKPQVQIYLGLGSTRRHYLHSTCASAC